MAPVHPHKPVTYYDVLEVSPASSLEEIRDAYRRMMLKWHPDRNRAAQRDAHSKMQTINEAYANLRDAQTRARYDAMLEKQRDRLTPLNDNQGHDNRGMISQFWSWLINYDTQGKPSS